MTVMQHIGKINVHLKKYHFVVNQICLIIILFTIIYLPSGKIEFNKPYDIIYYVNINAYKKRLWTKS